jgi:hypothetical protein
MAAQDMAKTAIITPFGLFEYLLMPFGLRNAAQTFQRFMDSLFKHFPFVFCYLDDIIIASHTLEEHHDHLRQENGLQINPAKCVFAAAAVEFLGHRVDQDGVRPLQRHVQAEQPRPPWRPRYHWRTQPRTPCSLLQQTPLIHTLAACSNS